MILKTGDMFDKSQADVLIVTTNQVIRRDGGLVMGRGAAATMAKKWPQMPFIFGAMVKRSGLPYGLLISRQKPMGRDLGIFQVKRDYMDPAELALIRHSTSMLTFVAGIMPQHKFALNFPGIGNGRLQREDVFPVIMSLPDNVEIWEL